MNTIIDSMEWASTSTTQKPVTGIDDAEHASWLHQLRGITVRYSPTWGGVVWCGTRCDHVFVHS
jgi:hypothetical protein